MDNELNADDRRGVELFVKENPDLEEELNLLMQTQLVPDNSFVFAGKKQLLKDSGTISISTNNYEEWLLSYTDNELPADQKIAVEQFIINHPAAKAELEFLQKTKSYPDTEIIFANKEVLYRTEEKVRVIAIRWRRIAVAAALLLAVSTTALLVLTNKVNNQEVIADGEKLSAPGDMNVKLTNTETITPTPKITDNIKDQTKEAIETNNPVADKDKLVEDKNIPYLPIETKKDEPAVVDIKEIKKTNDLPEPTNNPYVNKVVEDNPIAMIDPAVKEPLTNLKEINSSPTVTPNNYQPLDNVVTAASIEPVDEEQPGRKNKLRGFFRKVTRTFEKTTNIKATDDEDRLLLGGLAIKL